MHSYTFQMKRWNMMHMAKNRAVKASEDYLVMRWLYWVYIFDYFCFSRALPEQSTGNPTSKSLYLFVYQNLDSSDLPFSFYIKCNYSELVEFFTTNELLLLLKERILRCQLDFHTRLISSILIAPANSYTHASSIYIVITSHSYIYIIALLSIQSKFC